MLNSMAANNLMVGNFSIRETTMFDTIAASHSPQLKTHLKPCALSFPVIPSKNFNSKKLCLSSIRISTVNLNTEPLHSSSSTPLLLSGSCDHRLWAVRSSSDREDGFIPALLERPAYSSKQKRVDYNDYKEEEKEEEEDEEEEKEEEENGNGRLDLLSYLLNYVKDSPNKHGKESPDWNEWEAEILKETQPLITISRMILHSSRYRSGDRLSAQDEKIILEKLLPYHPDIKEKVGPGVENISVDYHTKFASSRCLFLVRKDGTSIDFSFWKCLRGLVRQKYPLHAEEFIQKHLSPRHNSHEANL